MVHPISRLASIWVLCLVVFSSVPADRRVDQCWSALGVGYDAGVYHPRLTQIGPDSGILVLLIGQPGVFHDAVPCYYIG